MIFKEGDVVRLKSGGPRMTVTNVGDRLGTASVWCSWFVGNKRDSEVFPVGAVEAVNTESVVSGQESSWVSVRRG